jgi:hypothetical protein
LREIHEEACQMKQDPQSQVEVRDVAPGLWICVYPD